jgi:hypothetical protein
MLNNTFIIIVTALVLVNSLTGCSFASEDVRVEIPASQQCASEAGRPDRVGPRDWEAVKQIFSSKSDTVTFTVNGQKVNVSGVTRGGLDAGACPKDILRSLEFEVTTVSGDQVEVMKSVLTALHERRSQGMIPPMDAEKLSMIENDFADMIRGTGVFDGLNTVKVPNQHDFEGFGHLALLRTSETTFTVVVTLDYSVN